MTNDTLANGKFKLEIGISYLLITGVIISLVLEMAGIIILYLSYGRLTISQDTSMFLQGHDFFTFTYQIFQGRYMERNALLLMTAGIIVEVVILISTVEQRPVWFLKHQGKFIKI